MADDDKFRRIFEMSLEMLCVAGPDGYFVELNPAWEHVLGWTQEELRAAPITEFVHPDDVEITTRNLTCSDQPVSFRNRCRTKAGAYRTLRWSARCDDLGLVYAAARDVTDFVAAVHRAERSEGLYRAVLETAVDPVILIDKSGTIIEVNESTEVLFGYRNEVMVGSNVSMLMPDPDRSAHDGYLQRYLDTGEARIIGIGRDVIALRSDGTSFPIRLSVSEVRGHDEPLFTGIIHDLTQQKAAEAALRRVNEELEQRVRERTDELESSLRELARSNRDLEQFAYIASHDLQAPLRNVRQGLELLDDHLTTTVGAGFDDEANELRRLVVGAVRKMEDLISGLLSYSRVQRTGETATQEISLDELLDGLLSQLRTDLDYARVSVEVGPMPTVSGDVTQLSQLMQNLLQNAIKYRSSEAEPTIGISSALVDGEHVISVSDNGIGVDEAKHDRIFELFRRGHPGYDGVGLGLAICQRIVERHGGRIWVESRPGEGATFSFTLPAGEPR